jgi:hypothetical protein
VPPRTTRIFLCHLLCHQKPQGYSVVPCSVPPKTQGYSAVPYSVPPKNTWFSR